MTNHHVIPRKDDNTSEKLYLAFELSNSKWKLGFSKNYGKIRIINIEAGDLPRLEAEIKKARIKLKLHEETEVISCYEAGRDGFWLHRYLIEKAIRNNVVDSSSIKVDRRRRRAKTDKIDVKELLNMLIEYDEGKKDVWSVVNVPSVRDEDDMRLQREEERLKKELTGHNNRIKSLLVAQGIKAKISSGFIAFIKAVKLWNGTGLARDLKAELIREYKRLELVRKQLDTIEKLRNRRIKAGKSKKIEQVNRLTNLRGIGNKSAYLFVMEFFGWRCFNNRREVGGLSGLSPTPYNSGNDAREQGISKSGNKRIRHYIVEISWIWLRYQPESKISKWFNDRFSGGKRVRRIGIVAVARKLLIALWKYLEFGEVPEGAIIK